MHRHKTKPYIVHPCETGEVLQTAGNNKPVHSWFPAGSVPTKGVADVGGNYLTIIVALANTAAVLLRTSADVMIQIAKNVKFRHGDHSILKVKPYDFLSL